MADLGVIQKSFTFFVCAPHTKFEKFTSENEDDTHLHIYGYKA